MIANRKNEIRSVLHSFQDQGHLDIYGQVGIGKTSFLHFICNKIDSKKFTPVFVDLPTINNFDKFINLLARNFDDIFHNEKYFSTIIQYINEQENYDTDTAIILFSASFDAITRSTNISLYLDNTEKVSREIWEQFENKILRYIDNADKKLKIITAGQRRIQWHHFRIKQQVSACRLDLFGKESIREMVLLLSAQKQFALRNKKTIIDAIYRLTLGHPKSIELIVRHWTKNYTQALDGHDIGIRYQQDILEEDIALLIDNFILPEIIEQANGLKEGEYYPASETLLSFLQYLAPLRFISAKILRETLSHLSTLSSFYNKQQSFFFNKLLRTLQAEHLVDWNEEMERYEFPAIVRHILQEDLKRHDTKKLIKLHQEIAAMYQELVKQSVTDRHADFIEQLYHVISWQEIDNARGRGRHDIEETLRIEIDRYLKKYREDSASLKGLLEQDDRLAHILVWKNIFSTGHSTGHKCHLIELLGYIFHKLANCLMLSSRFFYNIATVLGYRD